MLNCGATKAVAPAARADDFINSRLFIVFSFE
jgi:hypothetical protein